MIRLAGGNLLQAEAEALVNTVNTVGVMGKGIALQFRKTFPENYQAYVKACQEGEVQMGRMFVYSFNRLGSPKYIINFPTKNHWRDKARLKDIEAGLVDLVQSIQRLGIRSIAIPPLGCGFGGLDWKDVRPLIEKALTPLSEVAIFLYEPAGSPQPEDVKIETQKPNLTIGRAALIYLIDQYALPTYRLTQLEVQKLMYFLQAAGEPLKLDYQKKQYGPYAENLNFVLQRLEGHYILGYGDRSGRAAIHLKPGAKQEAEAFLESEIETKQRLESVLGLVEGFETPYGMELLATVHWLAQEIPEVRNQYEAAVVGFQSWNTRKREHFRPEHIQVAWERLRSQEWI